MRKVISLALFRPAEGEHRHDNAHHYFPRFLPALIRAARVIFPGWEIVIHHDDTSINCYYGSTLRLMHERGLVRMVYCGPTAALCHAMLWRMYPVIDGSADYVLCRDLDSLPMPRERMAVDRWLESGKSMHIMHDHPHHGPGAFIPGGLCGFWAPKFRELTGIRDLRQMLDWGHKHGIGYHAKGDDQIVLNGMLPPLIGDDYLLHPWDPATGHTQVSPLALPDVPLKALAEGNSLADYTGGVFNARAVCKFYDLDFFPTSIPVAQAEADVDEELPE
jgi:hypothetical protein